MTHAKPFQFGLVSLFGVTVVAAVWAWLPFFLRVGVAAFAISGAWSWLTWLELKRNSAAANPLLEQPNRQHREIDEKPPSQIQFGLRQLLLAMTYFGAALGIGALGYRIQDRIPPYLLLGLSYALGGAGIGVLDRKTVAGAAFGILVWLVVPFLVFFIR